MKATNITLNNQHYRYAVYPNSSNDRWGIFLIGNLQEIESVDFFSRYFSETLNLLVVEIPGTGLTQPLPARFSIVDQANLLLDLVGHLEIAAAHILSFSYATPVSLEFCKIFSGALSLSMGGAMPDIPPESRLRTIAIMADAIRDRRKFSREFIDILTVNSEKIPRGKVIARSAMQKVFKYTDEQIKCFCENTLRVLVYNPVEFFKVKIPTLVFIGEFDPYVTEKDALRLVSMLPSCIFEKIKNADHLVHLEQPEETARLMIFLAKNELSDKGLQNSFKEAV